MIFVIAHGVGMGASGSTQVVFVSWTEPQRGKAFTETARAKALTEPQRSKAWTHPAMTTLVKRTTESRIYTMDFVNFPEIQAGNTLASVTSVAGSPSGLTIGSGSITTTKIQARISGGTDKATYAVTYTALDSGSNTLVGIGYLLIDDQ